MDSILVRLAVLASLGREDALRAALLSKRGRRVRTRKIVETLLEVHLFAGFPATIDALIVLRAIRPQAGPVKAARRISGSRLIRKVYGENTGKLMTRMRGLDPDFSRWIVRHGYGTVLSRAGLSLRERELIAIGSLASLGWERQLRSHMQSALRLGIKKYEIGRVLRIVGEERREPGRKKGQLKRLLAGLKA